MKRIIDRKNFMNAAAFLEVDEKGNCRVYGKFYADGRGHSGPSTETLFTLSEDLLKEANSISMYDSKSPQLSSICRFIWAKAQKAEPWFRY